MSISLPLYTCPSIHRRHESADMHHVRHGKVWQVHIHKPRVAGHPRRQRGPQRCRQQRRSLRTKLPLEDPVLLGQQLQQAVNQSVVQEEGRIPLFVHDDPQHGPMRGEVCVLFGYKLDSVESSAMAQRCNVRP